MSSAFGMGFQDMTSAFMSSTIGAAAGALGSGMNWQNMTMNPNTWNFNDVNMSGAWGGVLDNTVDAGASGFASGFLGASLFGGTYNSAIGGHAI